MFKVYCSKWTGQYLQGMDSLYKQWLAASVSDCQSSYGKDIELYIRCKQECVENSVQGF